MTGYTAGCYGVCRQIESFLVSAGKLWTCSKPLCITCLAAITYPSEFTMKPVPIGLLIQLSPNCLLSSGETLNAEKTICTMLGRILVIALVKSMVFHPEELAQPNGSNRAKITIRRLSLESKGI